MGAKSALIPCEECDGAGTVSELCCNCNGSGEGMHDGTTCYQCHGMGETGNATCSTCKGAGEVSNPEVVPTSTQFEFICNYGTFEDIVKKLHEHGITQEKILADFLAVYERKSTRSEDAMELLTTFEAYMEILDA